MNVPFYQTEWLGINLPDLAQKLGHDLSQVAGASFYNTIYQTLFNDKAFFLDQAWLDKKHNLSNWIHSFIKSNALENAAILSVGCGFGIVELPLIQEGMNIHLQECQPYSIQYMQKKYPEVFKKTKFILSEDLSNIPSDSYDVVFSITSTYCLDQYTLLSFLKAVRRILKKGGLFIWYETVLSLDDIIHYIKTNIRQSIVGAKHHSKNILWGWKRSLGSQKCFCQKNGLTFVESYYFDQSNIVVTPQKFMGLPYEGSLAWQVGVYQY